MLSNHDKQRLGRREAGSAAGVGALERPAGKPNTGAPYAKTQSADHISGHTLIALSGNVDCAFVTIHFSVGI